jgi:hypothetical protein
MLTTSIEHNATYNKLFAARLQHRIVSLSAVLATGVKGEVRENFTASIALLRAIHDDIMDHPTNLLVFGMPVTQAMYGRIAAICFSLALSVLLRFVFATTTIDEEL